MGDDSDDLDNFDAFRKLVKNNSNSGFKREVKCVADLQKLKPCQIEVLEPDERELEYETTENVPTGIEAQNHSYWVFRIRTELPEKFHRSATVIPPQEALKKVGPRLAALMEWMGTYEPGKIKYFLPVYLWEKDPERSYGIMGVLILVPNTWISKCFRYVVVPKDQFYFLSNLVPATTALFEKSFATPDPRTWMEFSVVCYPRRNGWKTYEDAYQCLARITCGRDYAFMSDENEEPLDPNDTTKNWKKLTKMKAALPIIRRTVPATAAKNGSEFVSSAAKNKKRQEREAKLKQKKQEADPKAAALAARHPQAKWTRSQRAAATAAAKKPVDSSSDSDHQQQSPNHQTGPKRRRPAAKKKSEPSTTKKQHQPQQSKESSEETDGGENDSAIISYFGVNDEDEASKSPPPAEPPILNQLVVPPISNPPVVPPIPTPPAASQSPAPVPQGSTLIPPAGGEKSTTAPATQGGSLPAVTSTAAPINETGPSNASVTQPNPGPPTDPRIRSRGLNNTHHQQQLHAQHLQAQHNPQVSHHRSPHQHVPQHQVNGHGTNPQQVQYSSNHSVQQQHHQHQIPDANVQLHHGRPQQQPQHQSSGSSGHTSGGHGNWHPGGFGSSPYGHQGNYDPNDTFMSTTWASIGYTAANLGGTSNSVYTNGHAPAGANSNTPTYTTLHSSPAPGTTSFGIPQHPSGSAQPMTAAPTPSIMSGQGTSSAIYGTPNHIDMGVVGTGNTPGKIPRVQNPTVDDLYNIGYAIYEGVMEICAEIRVQREIRTENEKKVPKPTALNIPGIYKDALPFDDYKLLKEWDASMYCKERLPTNLTQDELQDLQGRKHKFERYVSYFATKLQEHTRETAALKARVMFTLFISPRLCCNTVFNKTGSVRIVGVDDPLDPKNQDNALRANKIQWMEGCLQTLTCFTALFERTLSTDYASLRQSLQNFRGNTVSRNNALLEAWMTTDQTEEFKHVYGSIHAGCPKEDPSRTPSTSRRPT